MQQFNYVIKEELGLHARPAGLLVREAKKFSSRITVAKNGKEVDATKLMAIMGMGIKRNDEVTVSVNGDDEEVAFTVLKEFFHAQL